MSVRAVRLEAVGRATTVLKVPLTRSSITLIVNAGLQAIAGYVFWQFVNHIMQPAGVGIVSAALAACTILATAASLGLGFSMIYARPRLGEAFAGVARAASVVTVTGSVLAALVFTAGIPLWAPRMAPYHGLVGWFAVAACVSGIALSSLQDYVFLAQKRPIVVVARTVLTVGTRLGALLVLVPRSGHIGAMVAFAFGTWATIIASLWLMRRPGPPAGRRRLDFRALATYGAYSRDTYLVALLGTATLSGLPVIALNLLGAGESAYFYVATMVAGMLFIIPGATSTALFMECADNLSRMEAQARHAVRVSLVGCGVGAACLLLLSPLVLLSFGTAYLRNAVAALVLLLLSGLPMTYYGAGQSLHRGLGQMKPIVLAGCGVLIATLGAATIGAHYLGLTGIALGWLAGQSTGTWLWFRGINVLRQERPVPAVRRAG